MIGAPFRLLTIICRKKSLVNIRIGSIAVYCHRSTQPTALWPIAAIGFLMECIAAMRLEAVVH
jgi:hypothetical protein